MALTAAEKAAALLAKDTFAKSLVDTGYSGAVLQAFPELGVLVKKAIATQMTPEGFRVAVHNSPWYMARSASQRAFDLLEKNDPKTFATNLATQVAQMQAEANSLGVPLSADRATLLARLSLRNAFTAPQVQAGLVAELHYDPKKTYSGVVGNDIAQMKQIAADQMFGMTDSVEKTWAAQFAAGTSDPTKFAAFAKDQAIAKYSHLAPQLDSGLTMKQIADPYRKAMADTLEVDPTSVTDSDPFIQKALSFRGTDGKGGLGLMPQYEAVSSLRRDPRWLNTQNAKVALTGAASMLGRMFGTTT